LKVQVEPFLSAVAASPDVRAAREFKEGGIDVRLSYTPGQQFAGGGHISYAMPYSPTKNPIYTALAKKAGQLRRAPLDALRVVVLCDAGCHAMRHSLMAGIGGSLTADQIVTEFLRSTTAVDAVLLVTVDAQSSFDHGRRSLHVSCRFAAAPLGKRSRVTHEAILAVRSLFNAALNSLPTPMLEPNNAAIHADQTDYGSGLHGAWQMNGRRISSRAVLELLAGKITVAEFQRDHGWDISQNPFDRALSEGRLISKVTVTSAGDQDDDWIEFEFGSVDPAASPFRR
jgi:hypothetical protein